MSAGTGSKVTSGNKKTQATGTKLTTSKKKEIIIKSGRISTVTNGLITILVESSTWIVRRSNISLFGLPLKGSAIRLNNILDEGEGVNVRFRKDDTHFIILQVWIGYEINGTEAWRSLNFLKNIKDWCRARKVDLQNVHNLCKHAETIQSKMFKNVDDMGVKVNRGGTSDRKVVKHFQPIIEEFNGCEEESYEINLNNTEELSELQPIIDRCNKVLSELSLTDGDSFCKDDFCVHPQIKEGLSRSTPTSVTVKKRHRIRRRPPRMSPTSVRTLTNTEPCISNTSYSHTSVEVASPVTKNKTSPNNCGRKITKSAQGNTSRGKNATKDEALDDLCMHVNPSVRACLSDPHKLESSSAAVSPLRPYLHLTAVVFTEALAQFLMGRNLVTDKTSATQIATEFMFENMVFSCKFKKDKV